MGTVAEIDFGCGAAGAEFIFIWGTVVDLNPGPGIGVSWVGLEAKTGETADEGVSFTA